MKTILFILTMLSWALICPAQTSGELQTTADLLYADGFAGMAWQKYQLAYNKSSIHEDKLRLLNRLSSVAVEAGKQKESLAIINESINALDKDLKPEERARLVLNASILNVNTGQFKQAHEECSKTLKNINQFPAGLQNKILETTVYALIRDSKLEEASVLIEKFRESFQNKTSIDLENARIKILMNQYVNAITILGKYSENKDALPHFLSLWAYLKSGDTNKAYDIYNSFLATLNSMPDPAFTGVIIKLAESTFKDKSKEAVILLDKIYEIEPDPNVKAYIYLKKAELLLQINQQESAIAALELFLKNFPQSNKSLQVQVQLAELYYRSGKQDLSRSTALLNMAIDANPNDKKLMYSALIMRAEVKQAIGTFTEAAGDYTAAALLAQKENLSSDEVCHPLYKAGIVKYIQADKTGVKEAFNDAAGSFYSAASVKSSYRSKAALMQIQSLRRAESYTMAVQVINQWLKIFPQNPDFNYLLGISLLEARKTLEGIKATNLFIAANKGDQRVPMAYVNALKASIYTENNDKIMRESEKLIISFEAYEKEMNKSDQFVSQASPYVKHLKAIFAWKNNYRVVAENLWRKFILDYPSHPLTPEVYLWLAFKSRTSQSKNINEAIKLYSSALAMLGETSLKGYTFIQLGKSYKSSGEFTNAVESLESAVNTFKKLKLDDSLSDDFANLLFYTGDLYARVGLYEEKAIAAFKEAEKLTADLNSKLALKGRIADCLFSAAGLIRNSDEKKNLYEEKIRTALAIYKEIYDNKNATKIISEQALYKMAKCYETLGNLKEKTSSNKDLADARTYYHELFFGFKDDLNKGIKRDPYFFCRTGYDLGRMLLSYDEKNIQSAISTYQVLADSGFTGTGDAAAMVEMLKEIQSSMDR